MAAVFVLAGCSGVPDRSAPQVVQAVQVASPTSQPTIAAPVVDASPSEIVNGFIAANAATDERHSAARAFLTPQAQTRWSDATVTIVSDQPTLSGVPGAGLSTVVDLTAEPIGQLGADGTFIPDLTGNGVSGASLTFSFTLSKKSGQWRIDLPPKGLIVTAANFTRQYAQTALYFLDSSETTVVPDLRYEAGSEAARCSALLAALAAGPRAALSNAVINEAPDQKDLGRVTARIEGSQVTAELPGSSHLDARPLQLLAAQVALTLDQVVPQASFTLTDGGAPVTVPAYGSGFTALNFAALHPVPPAKALFYVHDGVRNELGRALPGLLGRKTGASAVALFDAGTPNYFAAVVSGEPGRQRLELGRLNDLALVQARIAPGPLSRPAWTPGSATRPEVWVAARSGLIRIVISGTGVDAAQVTTATPLSGTARSLAFSPDGTRVAIVLAGAGARQQVWIGSVVRSAQQVRVDGLEQITPPDVAFTDVAWNSSTRLYAVGTDLRTGLSGVWEVKSDGSGFDRRAGAGLPAAPTSIATTLDAFPVVSAAGRIYRQRASWELLLQTADASVGSNPVYLQ